MDSGKAKAVKCVDGVFQLLEEDIPKVEPGKLVIKVAFATVNPHDRYAVEAHK